MATHTGRAGRPLKRDAERTQADLLAVASDEFARLGFYGARVDEIAARSATTKRMIYYYFTDKEGLYQAVLEKAYADIRAAEMTLELDHLDPVQALSVLIRHTFEYHAANPTLARLVVTENSLGAVHLRSSERQRGVNLPIITVLDDILARGRASGVFVRDANSLDLHLMMSALALFRVTNQPTVEATFQVDIGTAPALARAIEMLTSMMITWLRTPQDAPA